MRAKLGSLVPLMNGSGPQRDRAETVTIFNDLCVFAPGALVGANVCWETIDAHRVRGVLPNDTHIVAADLFFNDIFALVVSDDRLRASSDGKGMSPQRGSTRLWPIRNLERDGSQPLAKRDGTRENLKARSQTLRFLRSTICIQGRARR